MITPQFLVLFGLAVLPFVLSFDFAPFFSHFIDHRQTKDVLAILISSSVIGLYFRYHPSVKKLSTPFLLLVGYCVLRCFLTPQFSLLIINEDVTSIWQYRALAYDLLFGALFIVVSNMCWNTKGLRRMFSTICWVGFLTAMYCLIQRARCDQWQMLLPLNDLHFTPSAEMVGTMTHVTLAAAFLIIPVPFMIQTRRWLQLSATCTAIYLCHSDVAYVALAATLIIYGLLKGRIWRRITLGVLALSIFVVLLLPENTVRINDNGRFGIWKQVGVDVMKSPFEKNKTGFLTGYGLGSYRYLFTALHTTSVIGKARQIKFNKAHNEYVEWFYNTGIIGIALLLIFIFYLIKNGIPYTIIDERYLAVISALAGICICAGGTFVWQIEPHRFYTVVLAAIIQNRINQGEKQA